MLVRELVTRLGFSVDQSKLAGYNGAINNIKSRAQEAQNSVAGIFSAFAAFASLKSIGKTADEMQSLEARIGMLPQTIGSAGDAFDHIADKASAARQGIAGYAGFYIKAASATQDFLKSQEDVIKVVDGAAIALAASGSDATRQKEAFFQLGQAIGSPVIQMEEMNTIIDVAPDLFRALGKAIPGAEGNLKKFVGTGKVTGEMLARGLMKILPDFQEQMQKMPMNFGTSFVLIGNKWSKFINKLNRESMAVTKMSNFFLAAFDKIEGGLDSMVDFFGGATNTLKFFGIALAAAFAPMLFSGIVGSISLLLSPIGLLVIGLAAIGLALEDVYQWMTGGTSIIGSFFGEFKSFAPMVEKIKGYFDKLLSGDVLGKFIAMVIKIKDYLYDVIPFQKIADSLMAIAGYAMNIFFGIVDVIVGAFKAIIGFLTGDFDLLFAGLKQIFSGLGDIIFSTIGILINAIYIAFDLVKAYLTTAWHAIGVIIFDSIFGNIKGAAIKGFEYLKGLVGMGSDDKTKKPEPTTEKKIINLDVLKSAASQPSQNAVAPATAAASASPSFASTNKAPTGMSQNIITINQTLPPGTTQETAAAAKSATASSAGEAFNAMARKAGQAS